MPNLGDLQPKHGSTRARKRVGRGAGSGKGKTAGSGVKGQGTRTGGGPSRGRREGGQMPLAMRLPKKGFNNKWRTVHQIVNVVDLARLGDGATVDLESLARVGLIRAKGGPVKLLGEGEAPKSLTVKVHKASAQAKAKIEGQGG